jgi:hypothetical protein
MVASLYLRAGPSRGRDAFRWASDIASFMLREPNRAAFERIMKG